MTDNQPAITIIELFPHRKPGVTDQAGDWRSSRLLGASAGLCRPVSWRFGTAVSEESVRTSFRGPPHAPICNTNFGAGLIGLVRHKSLVHHHKGPFACLSLDLHLGRLKRDKEFPIPSCTCLNTLVDVHLLYLFDPFPHDLLPSIGAPLDPIASQSSYRRHDWKVPNGLRGPNARRPPDRAGLYQGSNQRGQHCDICLARL